MEELRKRLSGVALPVYAVDLPGGGGKIPLTRNRLEREDSAGYYFKSFEGNLYKYPKEGDMT